MPLKIMFVSIFISILCIDAYSAQEIKNRFIDEQKIEKYYTELSTFINQNKDSQERIIMTAVYCGDAALLPIKVAMKNALFLENIYDNLDGDREKILAKLLVRMNLFLEYQELVEKKKLLADIFKSTSSQDSKEKIQKVLDVFDQVIAVYDAMENNIQRFFPSKQ